MKNNYMEITREEAKEFYEKTNTSKGRLQFDFEENKIIDMYFCENYYNYSYEIIADTTGKVKVFDVVKYQDGFLIRYPSSKTPTEMSEFKDTKKLSWALEEFEKIHSVLDVLTVYKLNKAVEEGRIKDIIMLAEALHEKKIANIADDIKKRKNTKMVLIAGPSSSGKTTFAQRLGIQLRLNGIKPVTLSVDNYFVERQDTPRNENGEYNFECIEAIDLKLFNEHLVKLLNGEEIEVPELNDGTVMLYSVARDAGSRTKIAVYTEYNNVDPIGAVIGEKGRRIAAVLKELNGEKIDVILYDKDPVKFITNALSPAKDIKVTIKDENKKEALAVVGDNNLSLAIGKRGQNVKLASRLTHYKIEVKSQSAVNEENAEEVEASEK